MASPPTLTSAALDSSAKKRTTRDTAPSATKDEEDIAIFRAVASLQPHHAPVGLWTKRWQQVAAHVTASIGREPTMLWVINGELRQLVAAEAAAMERRKASSVLAEDEHTTPSPVGSASTLPGELPVLDAGSEKEAALGNATKGAVVMTGSQTDAVSLLGSATALCCAATTHSVTSAIRAGGSTRRHEKARRIVLALDSFCQRVSNQATPRVLADTQPPLNDNRINASHLNGDTQPGDSQRGPQVFHPPVAMGPMVAPVKCAALQIGPDAAATSAEKPAKPNATVSPPSTVRVGHTETLYISYQSPPNKVQLEVDTLKQTVATLTAALTMSQGDCIGVKKQILYLAATVKKCEVERQQLKRDVTVLTAELRGTQHQVQAGLTSQAKAIGDLWMLSSVLQQVKDAEAWQEVDFESYRKGQSEKTRLLELERTKQLQETKDKMKSLHQMVHEEMESQRQTVQNEMDSVQQKMNQLSMRLHAQATEADATIRRDLDRIQLAMDKHNRLCDKIQADCRLRDQDMVSNIKTLDWDAMLGGSQFVETLRHERRFEMKQIRKLVDRERDERTQQYGALLADIREAISA